MKNLVVVFFLLLAGVVSAQDTIIKKNGDLIKAKITEISKDEVKFKIYGQEDSPVITMDRADIKIAVVGGQRIINTEDTATIEKEDIIVKKSGDILKVKVYEIGTEEIKFKLFNNPDGPSISMLRTDIKTMKVDGQTVIDVKTGLTEDIILKKDGSVIKAKISELGEDEVKYKLYSSPDGPVMAIKKSDIESIKIDGQSVYQYERDPLEVSNDDIQNRTNTVKFYFFSPLNNHIDIGYEWMNKPGFNWDVAIGFIGIGMSGSSNRNPQGVFLRAGPKFLLGNTADVVSKKNKKRFAHPLKGKYIKVEFILNAF